MLGVWCELSCAYFVSCYEKELVKSLLICLVDHIEVKSVLSVQRLLCRITCEMVWNAMIYFLQLD
jgi:hypothetical protein